VDAVAGQRVDLLFDALPLALGPLEGRDVLSGVDLVGSLLTGVPAVPNLVPGQGPPLAPVPTVLPGDAGGEAPANPAPAAAAPWIDFLIGLDDTLHTGRRVPAEKGPGAGRGATGEASPLTAAGLLRRVWRAAPELAVTTLLFASGLYRAARGGDGTEDERGRDGLATLRRSDGQS
jgi:hypothetical protein